MINLNDYLTYCPTSGVITAKVRLGNKPKGSIMGSVDKEGYLSFVVQGKRYYAHRVAWFIQHGLWPERIDHKNLKRADNRLVNLRECSQAENLRNRPMQRNNSTGYKGVRQRGARFYGAVKLDGKLYYTSRYNSIQEAHTARCTLAKELHGEYYHP